MKRIMMAGAFTVLWACAVQGVSKEEQLLQALQEGNRDRVADLLGEGVAPVYVIAGGEGVKGIKRTTRVNALNFALEVCFDDNDPSLVRTILEPRKREGFGILDEQNYDRETPRDVIARRKGELARRGELRMVAMSDEEFIGSLIRRSHFNSEEDELNYQAEQASTL